jgi:PAS domain S-box-containing protein
MKTIIIGGGRGCRALIELVEGSFLTELTLEIRCVVDPRADAEGMVYARERGIRTSANMADALALPGIELIIELTGSDVVLEEIYRLHPPGVKLIDHTFAHVFWDLVNARNDRERRLREMTELERKIVRERHFLQSVLDNIPELLVVLDPDGHVVKVNQSFSSSTRVSAEDALGKNCLQLLDRTLFAENARELPAMLESVTATGRGISMIWQTPPPVETYWEVSCTPIIGTEGALDAILTSWHQITEQVMLRRKIETREQRLSSFIDSAQDWISMKDLEGRYIIVNPVCAAAFGRKPADFVGKKVDDLLPPGLARMTMQHDQEVIRSNRPRTYNEVVPIDGRDHHFQAVRFPLTNYQGKTTGVCTIMRDVTTEHELNSQLAQATKLAAVGQLAAGVAHEINNPLTGILAYAEDLRDELAADSELQDDIKVIIRETLRCRDIVRNLLDFARQEKPKLKNINPNEIMDRALTLVEKLPQFRNITIWKRRAEHIPQVRCDIHQIQQVILNLMLNAADAMQGKGMIIISTEFDRRHDKCLIAVRDSGPGIPENMIDKIFEPFFSTKGTSGLGLAVSWGIVERHGGVIEIDIPEGGGTVFQIVLPAATGAAEK